MKESLIPLLYKLSGIFESHRRENRLLEPVSGRGPELSPRLAGELLETGPYGSKQVLIRGILG
ncbi:MAG: hypothetical protein AB7W16_14270 [Candidatus Obscuribacterales bacterium]